MYLIKTITATAMLCLAAFAYAEVNINTATAQQLTELNNIGDVKASAIVDYRMRHGHFRSVDDLLKVEGIGPIIVEINRDMLTVGTDGVQTLPGEEMAPVEGSVPTQRYVPSTNRATTNEDSPP